MAPEVPDRQWRDLPALGLVLGLTSGFVEGLRVSQPVSNAAIPATIIDVIGAAALAPMVPSLVRLWTGEATAEALPIAELRRRDWAPERQPVHSGSLRSVVGPRWHLIEHETSGSQLFDWVADPREVVDRSQDPRNAGIMAELRRPLTPARSQSAP